jgi:uncharacterized protein GlcG (DUF336 family)
MSDAIVSKSSISSNAAQVLIASAVARAQEIGVASVVAVVDEAGLLKALGRMDGSPLGSLKLAQDKAYSAASNGLATDQWYAIAQQDPSFGFGLSAVERLAPMGGGIPITVDGALVGGIGVSGGSVEQDIDVASAALAALGG